MGFRVSTTGGLVSGIVYVIKNGLQWKDAPRGYGPHKTLYNRFIRWSRLGVFDRIFAALAAEGPKPERIMIDSTHLKAHRTALWRDNLDEGSATNRMIVFGRGIEMIVAERQ
jgi:transposase